MEKQSNLFQIITPIVVDNGKFFINDLFNKKFGCDAPDKTNHLIAFYKSNSGNILPVTYTSFLPHKNVILVGGAMTNGDVIKSMSDEEKKIISDSGGIYLNMLKYAFKHFANECDAFFGLVNDPRALEVDLTAGFQKTPYQFLVAHYHKPISKWKKNKLERMISKIGPF